MTSEGTDKGLFDLPDDLRRGRRVILGELKDRSVWFIKLRWFVPFGITGGTILAGALGIRLESAPILFLIAAFILAYNSVFFLWRKRLPETVDISQRERLRYFTRWQVGFDYISMFMLVHYTGGISSPFIFFFIFHIIFASILLRSKSSYEFAALVIIGVTVIALGEYYGYLKSYPIIVSEQPIMTQHHLSHIVIILSFFSASVIISSISTTMIVVMLRRRISNLVLMSRTINRLNEKLNSLFAMTEAIGTVRDMNKVLNIVSAELGRIIGVSGISIKLLKTDNNYLHVASAHGVVKNILEQKDIDMSNSSVCQSVIYGREDFIGELTHSRQFEYYESMRSLNIRSVLFVPLIADDQVIGILSAYCFQPDRFGKEDIEFVHLAADLTAIAIENTRSYQAIRDFDKKRAWFMMRAAHNLRAPLAAIISMIDVLRKGYLGNLAGEQDDYLQRIYRRSNAMLTTINELLALSEKDEPDESKMNRDIDFADMSIRVERTFKDSIAAKGLTMKVTVADDLPIIKGDPDAIRQVFENLISNAIKYTPRGGKITLEFLKANGSILIHVGDNGIGIPEAARNDIFKEFYRAENAKALDEVGSGLGLTIVKRIIEMHGGKIHVESEEGLGSLFVIHLPINWTVGHILSKS
ncbi:MAG: GAF domain-containing sensor histidine kinase [Candidatus Zixiibacteriota bacterium]